MESPSIQSKRALAPKGNIYEWLRDQAKTEQQIVTAPSAELQVATRVGQVLSELPTDRNERLASSEVPLLP
jgi:hypothetical protein